MGVFFSKDVRFYFGGYDPGTAMTRFRQPLEVGALDNTTFTQAAERVLPDIRQDKLEWAGLFDDGADSLDAAVGVLVGTSTNNHISILYGTATGNRAYSGTALQIGLHQPAEIRGLIRSEAVFIIEGQWKPGAHYGAKQTLTGTSGTAVTGTIDNTAASTGSGTLFVHVLTITGGTSSLVFEDSADNVTYAGLVTLVATGKRSFATSVGSAGSGTIRRYTRVRHATGTGTSAEFAAVLVRGS